MEGAGERVLGRAKDALTRDADERAGAATVPSSSVTAAGASGGGAPPSRSATLGSRFLEGGRPSTPAIMKKPAIGAPTGACSTALGSRGQAGSMPGGGGGGACLSETRKV